MSGLSEGISSAGSALGQALQMRGQKKQERRGLDAFNIAVGGAEGDSNAIAQAYTQALNAGADSQQLGMLAGAYQSARKQNAFKSSYDLAIEAGGMDTEAGKFAFLEEYSKSGGNPVEGIKFFKEDRKGQTVFDKKIDEFKAKAVIDHMQGGDVSQKTFDDNLNFLEQNVDEVGRIAAITGGSAGLLGGGEYGPFQSAAFSEYERRGNLVLDGVIKVFNKAGVLPEKKLKWIRDTFAISPFDTQEQIRGRLAALRSLSKGTSGFEEGIGLLIDKYGDDIPNSKFLKLQRNLNKSFDKFEGQFAFSTQPQGKGRVYEKLPTSGIKKGDVATDTVTGKKFVWTGSRWSKSK
jgi:hypothetical protein